MLNEKEKVYLVYEDNHVEGFDMREIFTTKEKAEEYIKHMDTNNWPNFQWLNIMEMELLNNFTKKYELRFRVEYGKINCYFRPTISKHVEQIHDFRIVRDERNSKNSYFVIDKVGCQSELTSKQEEIIKEANKNMPKYNKISEIEEFCINVFNSLDFK